MPDFYIELTGPNAEADAEALRRALNGSAQAQAAPPAIVRGIDSIVVITVTAAVLQSIDILYRFYQDWKGRQRPLPGSQPQMTIIRADGTRIELAATDVETVKALLKLSE